MLGHWSLKLSIRVTAEDLDESPEAGRKSHSVTLHHWSLKLSIRVKGLAGAHAEGGVLQENIQKQESYWNTLRNHRSIFIHILEYTFPVIYSFIPNFTMAP